MRPVVGTTSVPDAAPPSPPDPPVPALAAGSRWRRWSSLVLVPSGPGAGIPEAWTVFHRAGVSTPSPFPSVPVLQREPPREVLRSGPGGRVVTARRPSHLRRSTARVVPSRVRWCTNITTPPSSRSAGASHYWSIPTVSHLPGRTPGRSAPRGGGSAAFPPQVIVLVRR